MLSATVEIYKKSEPHMASERPKKSGNNKAESRSLTRQAYDEVKWRIIADDLHAGSLLSENDLCEMTGLGKAPIRAALMELKHDRLVDVVPRKGFFVRPWSWDEARELLQMRRLVEPELAGKAAIEASDEDRAALQVLVVDSARHIQTANRRALIENDNDFHVGIAKASGSTVGAEIVEMLKLRSHYLWHVSISSQKQLAAVQLQHEEIMKSILDRDAKGASTAMLEHLSLLDSE